jgi:tRNA threonylcarbamoyladenosine biosynthesis protein TsaB
MSEEKPILAIETTENICGVCVYFSESKYFESRVHLKNAHAEKLFEIINFEMSSAGIKIQDLDSVAVSSGPGSFTGLRIGMSAAKGIAFGASLPIVKVPTFEALALQISGFLPKGTEFVIANKVNSDEIYFAKFQITANNFIFVEKLKIINHAELLSQSEKCCIFGNAIYNNNNDINTKFIIASPNPFFVAKWAKLKGEKVYNFDYMEPDYLKNFIASIKPKTQANFSLDNSTSKNKERKNV